MRLDKKNWHPYVIVVLLLLLPTIASVISLSQDQLVRFFPDDAFYYLQSAFNAAHAGRVSFDGITETNGFHPLQFLVSYFFATVLTKDGLLRFAVAENAILVISTALLLAANLCRDCSRKVRPAIVAMLSFPIWYLYIWLDAGMEMGLVLFGGALFYCSWERAYTHEFVSIRENCWVSASAAVLILARLDMALPLSLFALVYATKGFKPGVVVRHWLAPAMIAVVILSPYLTWNLMKFGHLVPISGVVKAGIASDMRANWRSLTGGSRIGELLVLLPLLSAAVVLWLKSQTIRSRSSFLLLVASTVFYYGYIIFYATQVFRWYLAFPLVLQMVSISLLINGSLKHWNIKAICANGTAVGLAIFSAVLHAALYAWIARIETTSLYLKNIADDLNKRLDANDIIATYDAGVLGYFSQARVVNLDGLANSYEYYESYLLTGRVDEYLRKIKATHYLARVEAERKLPFVQSEEPKLLARYNIPGQFDLELYQIGK